MPTSIILYHLENSNAFMALCWKLLKLSEICKKLQVAESE